jgi:hypothetical protein
MNIGTPNADPPVSFTPEYKALKDLRDQFPEYYAQAKDTLGIKPDTVPNCVNLMAEINNSIDQSMGQDATDYEPPSVSDTSGF